MNEELYEKYLAGTLTSEESETFKRMMEDPEISADFFEFVEQDYLMRLVTQEQVMEKKTTSVKPPTISDIPKIDPIPLNKKEDNKTIIFILSACAAILF